MPSPTKNPYGPKRKSILHSVRRPEFRADASGEWPFDTEELIRNLVEHRRSLDDPKLQEIFLDWIESEDYNKFINLETGEIIYAQSAKRGNVVYATRKTKNRDRVKDALTGSSTIRSRDSATGG
jgi:hypothetical protein